MNPSASAAAQALSELRARRASKRNFCPHEPTPPQQRFLDLQAREALYGGAAGGGKTDALLMAAAQYVHVPGYAAMLLRRTYADLAKDDAIMTRAKSWWIPQGISWSEKDKRFTFPSGATIAFGYLDSDGDKYNYQGGAWQFIGFDELTQFPEAWYTYLLSRLRKPASMQVPLRARGASNPGGIGHDWVYARFVRENAPAAFVPAALADNPHLDQNDYRQMLSLVEPTLRRQLEEGLWIRDGVGLVYEHFEEKRNIAPSPTCETYILGCDFGVKDENALTIVGWNANDSNVYIPRSFRVKGITDKVAAEIQALDAVYHFAAMYGDTGGMGKLFVEELAARFGIGIQPAEKANKLGFISLLNSDLALGRIILSPFGCENLISEWKTLAWHPSRLIEDPKMPNHASDSALYAWRASLAFHERPLPEEPKPGTLEAAKKVEDRMRQAALKAVDVVEDEWGGLLG